MNRSSCAASRVPSSKGSPNSPPEVTWFANIRNANTRRAYERDVRGFSLFTGIQQVEEYRLVTRAHVIAWSKDLESRSLSPSTIWRKLSDLSSLFDSLCEANTVTHNPVSGVTRPNEGANEGRTPALSDAQARVRSRLLPSTPLKASGPGCPGDAPLSRHPA